MLEDTQLPEYILLQCQGRREDQVDKRICQSGSSKIAAMAALCQYHGSRQSVHRRQHFGPFQQELGATKAPVQGTRIREMVSLCQLVTLPCSGRQHQAAVSLKWKEGVLLLS